MNLPDAMVLCGGLGTRLQAAVPDRPKGLAMIAGRAFLDILVDELVAQGFRRIIFCTGHGADKIADHFAGRTDGEFAFSTEPLPLGTGGAVRLACALARSDPLVVVNGDSFCPVAYRSLVAFHGARAALATVVLTPPTERTDVGLAELAPDGRLRRFAEKGALAGAPLVNAGIYVLQKRLVEEQPAQPFSLERELLPQAIEREACYGFPVAGPLIDIGTPERYRAAQALLARH